MKAKELLDNYKEHCPELVDAINSGGDFRGIVESAEGADEEFIYEEESDSWYSVFYMLDCRVESGVPEVVLLRCWDGDWDTIYSYQSEEELPDLYEEAIKSHREKEAWGSEKVVCLACGDMYPRKDLDQSHCVECIVGQAEEAEYYRIGTEI
jgi:hypothetical protein